MVARSAVYFSHHLAHWWAKPGTGSRFLLGNWPTHGSGSATQLRTRCALYLRPPWIPVLAAARLLGYRNRVLYIYVCCAYGLRRRHCSRCDALAVVAARHCRRVFRRG